MFLFTTPPAREPAPVNPVVDAIRQGAEKTGTGFDYLLATAQRESALDPKARARSSSASGLFQFIEQTWLGLVRTEGPKLGLGDQANAIAAKVRSGTTRRSRRSWPVPSPSATATSWQPSSGASRRAPISTSPISSAPAAPST